MRETIKAFKDEFEIISKDSASGRPIIVKPLRGNVGTSLGQAVQKFKAISGVAIEGENQQYFIKLSYDRRSDSPYAPTFSEQRMA